MKMPVPSDWDGESTCDFLVKWPDSSIWRIILRGLLTNPSLAEFWDASTGDVEQLLTDFRPIMIAALDNLECGAMEIPIGTIFEFAGSTLPDKFLWCDGSAVPIADYLELYQAIGDSYFPGGIGIPENFYLPDKRGGVGVGKDITQSEFNTLGKKGGAKTHTLTTGEIPGHTHTEESFDGGTPAAVIGQSGAGLNIKRLSRTTGSTGGGGAHNNLQPYLTVNFMIRAK